MPVFLSFIALFAIVFIAIEENLLVSATEADRLAFKISYHEELVSHDEAHHKSERKNEDLTVLGFVTPWNSNGKEVAISQASQKRLDITSLVSWQMHPDGLAGGEDFEDSIYKELSKSGSEVYPRVLFERWNLEDFKKLSEDPEPLSHRLIQLCESRRFDGVVIEIWQSLLALGAFHGPQKQIFLKMVKDIGDGVRRKTGIHTVLVLPPYAGVKSTGGLSTTDFEELRVGFSYFVVMTYDFSTPGSRPGPMAPIRWVRAVSSFLAKDCGLGQKVLLGLNFYGVDFLQRGEGQASDDRHVLGHEYIALLEKHKPELVWLDEVGEHVFGYSSGGQQRIVFYPTRQSVALRVAVAKEVGCGGVAIWELGQGLNHFFGEF